MNFFKALVFFYFLVFHHEVLSILPHRLLTEPTVSGLNQTAKLANNVPHVYYVNLDKASDRKKSTQNLLDGCGYRYTRIKALTPKDLFKELPLNFSTPKLRNREIGREILKSCTISHLKAIYTAVRDYKLATAVHNSAQKMPHYALMIEDDIRFLFDFHDWKGIHTYVYVCPYMYIDICIHINIHVYKSI
jgi:GR25 family glycosyltransferase involved in LPS biosynthesis